MPVIDSRYAVIQREQNLIDLDAAMSFVADDRFGAAACFIGKVRNHSHGRQSLGVSYDVYQPLAIRTFETIASEAVAALEHDGRVFDIKINIEHASGRLAIGETAVVVAVGSPHRAESLQLCAELIERVKHEAPIWKKEHFGDGDSVWVQGCALCAPSNDVSLISATHKTVAGA